MDDLGFFTLLAHRAGSQQRENQLSATFAACFNYSPQFRRMALDAVRRACRITKPLPRPAEWTCSTEVTTPKKGGGRPDIAIRPSLKPRSGSLPIFWLENKVNAPLTERQLKKYRKHGCDFLVAITKHRPEVTASKLKTLGAFAVRWQDFHRAFTDPNGAKGQERFIIESFVTYLEDLGMAHRRRITEKELEHLGTVLKTMRSENRWVAVKDAFETGDALVEVLDEVRARLLEAFPKLEERSRAAVKCGVWTDGDTTIDWFGWHLYKNNYANWHFDVGMFFSREDGSVWFNSQVGGKATKEEYDEWSLKQVSTRGVLDEDQLFAVVKRSAQRWGVV